MAESTGEKTEKATPHKLREQRKEGNVMQSKDVVTAAFILLVFFMLRIMAKLMYKTAADCVTYWLGIAGGGMENGRLDGMRVSVKLILEAGKATLFIAGPVLLASILIPVIVGNTDKIYLFKKILSV